ncbi:MAG: hypothetical protein ACRDQY_09140 [Pseudonocardiaceae bacterium]
MGQRGEFVAGAVVVVCRSVLGGHSASISPASASVCRVLLASLCPGLSVVAWQCGQQRAESIGGWRVRLG